jgi:hypothetical protein
VGITRAYKVDGDYCMMRIRTDAQLRSALARAMQKHERKDAYSMIANIMLADMDSIIINTWSHLSDMGLSKVEMEKIRKVVKRRL